MGKNSLIQKDITSGFVYVFFQHADYPTNPAYIVFDSNLETWSDPVVLTTMSLHDQENGVYNSDPRAVYWKNKIYLFGRGKDDSALAMTYDGAAWSAPVTLKDKSCNAITPRIFHENLYIFFPGASDGNPVCCTQYDGDLNFIKSSVSQAANSTWPVDFSEISTYYNSCGTLWATSFDGSGFGMGTDRQTDYDISYGPTVIGNETYASVEYDVFFRGLSDARLFDNYSNINRVNLTSPIDGINISTSPSAVCLGRDGTSADFAVFYVENDDVPNLKMAIIRRTLPGDGTITLSLTAIQNIDVPVAPSNASPFAIVIG